MPEIEELPGLFARPGTADSDLETRERTRSVRPGGWLTAGLDALDEFGAMVEKRPEPVVLCLLIVCLAVALSNNQRPLWYDELTTNLPAQRQVPLLHFGRTLREILQHGLLSPLFVRISTGIFGLNNCGYRLPAFLGYLIASASMYLFLLRARTGNLFALFAVLIFWSTPAFYYAVEARPYGLILGFAGILSVAWQHAISHERRKWSLAAIALSELGLVFSHPLAILAAMPIFFAELTRFRLRRRTDWPLWFCAGYPALGIFPLFLAHPVHPAYSSLLTGRLSNGIYFYRDILEAVALPLMFAAFAALTVRRAPAAESEFAAGEPLKRAEYALLSGGLPIPFVVSAVLAATATNPYFPRYAISGTLPVPMIAAVVLASRTGRNPRVGILAVGAAFVCFLFGQMQKQQPYVWKAPPVASAPLVESRNNLPFVVASGLTFVEMGNREPVQFLSRVFYLRDPEGAVRYASSGLFEIKDFADYQDLVPHHGIVTPYAEFTRAHRRFLVYGTMDYWEDWLLRRLLAEGAQLVWLGEVRSTYKDVGLYEVTLLPGTEAPVRTEAK